MSSAETSVLIDRIAMLLDPHFGHNEDAADTVATEIVGELQSRFFLIPIPTAAQEAATRADLAELDIPGFHDFIPPTKGRT